MRREPQPESGKTPEPDPWTIGQRFASLALFAILGVLVWGKVAGFEFVWDDKLFIVFNPALREWSSLPAYFFDVTTMAGGDDPFRWALFRPLRNLSWLMDFKIAGLQPGWWHVHNLLLHIVNAVLVMLVARRLLPRQRFAALVAGLVFLLHPVQSEAVAWVKTAGSPPEQIV